MSMDEAEVASANVMSAVTRLARDAPPSDSAAIRATASLPASFSAGAA